MTEDNKRLLVTDEDAYEEQPSIKKRLLIAALKTSSLIMLASMFCSFLEVSTLSSKFEQNVTTHLERAAHASTIEVSEAEVKAALTFVKAEPRFSRFLTDDDLLFSSRSFKYWYQNLEGTRQTLKKTSFDAPISEKEIVLAGVSRSLLTENWLGKKEVNLPEDPDIQLNFLMGVMSFGGCFSVYWIINLENKEQ